MYRIMLHHAASCMMQTNIKIMLAGKSKGGEHVPYTKIYVQIHENLITAYLHVY